MQKAYFAIPFNAMLIQFVNNSYYGLKGLRIAAIPHISVINPNYEENGVSETLLAELKTSMKNLYDSVLAQWVTTYNAEQRASEMSVELRWESVAVTGQAYRANINLYVIIRQRTRTREACEAYLSAMSALVQSQFSTLKFEVRNVDDTELLLRPIVGSERTFCTLVKHEEILNLGNSMMQTCYCYDRFEMSQQSLRQLVSVLSKEPGCIVSYMLTPTMLMPQECNFLIQNNNMLTALANGMQFGNQNIPVAIARRPADIFSYYAACIGKPIFIFSIGVQATAIQATTISGILASQYRVTSGALGLRDLTGGIIRYGDTNFNLTLPWLINNLQQHPAVRNPQMSALGRLPFLITSEEAAEFAYFPYGTKDTSAGMNICESTFDVKKIRKELINHNQAETSSDFIVGRLRTTDEYYIKLPLSDLPKHMFVSGTPGMGKSEFSISLVHRLHQKGIPFLVIEPAKNEYRALQGVIPNLQIFTPGKDHISPFRTNLFMPPPNVALSSYKSTLKSFFEATASTADTLATLYADAIDLAYSSFGWLDFYTPEEALANGAQVFSLSDFIKCYDMVFAARGYTNKNADIGVAGRIRLQKLLRFFDSYESVPISDLLGHPTVIELNAIEHEVDKATIMCYLLMSILSYINSNFVGDGNLRQCIFLEEAHVLLDTNRKVSENQPNPSEVAKTLILRMLKELRSVGVAFIIADQSPSAVGLDVVAMTGTKLSFNIVERNDRQILSDCMGLTDVQFDRLGRFIPGEAYVRSSSLSYAEEVRTLLYRESHGIPISISDKELSKSITYWQNPENAIKLKPYPECRFNGTCKKSGTCDLHICAIARQITDFIYEQYRKELSNLELAREIFAEITIGNNIIKKFTGGRSIPGLATCVRIHLARKLYFNGTRIPSRGNIQKYIIAK